jgi:hypothetical protein
MPPSTDDPASETGHYSTVAKSGPSFGKGGQGGPA